MNGSVVTLHQHLTDTCCTTEVTIYLERRMGIEKVGVGTSVRMSHDGLPILAGQDVKHVFDNLECMVAIEHACPEVGLPTQTPASSHVATLLQGVRSGREEFWMTVWGDLIGRIESIEV